MDTAGGPIRQPKHGWGRGRRCYQSLSDSLARWELCRLPWNWASSLKICRPVCDIHVSVGEISRCAIWGRLQVFRGCPNSNSVEHSANCIPRLSSEDWANLKTFFVFHIEVWLVIFSCNLQIYSMNVCKCIYFSYCKGNVCTDVSEPAVLACGLCKDCGGILIPFYGPRANGFGSNGFCPYCKGKNAQISCASRIFVLGHLNQQHAKGLQEFTFWFAISDT